MEMFSSMQNKFIAEPKNIKSTPEDDANIENLSPIGLKGATSNLNVFSVTGSVTKTNKESDTTSMMILNSLS
jgi:hypothetical protein